ncbi:MAG: ribosome recycling factor [Bdellovibrionota bacterium]|nr:ribosome recycling factor [Bdellovibrionota bacterium]
MIDELLLELEEGMEKSINSLKNNLSKVRTGRASANVLDGVNVDYYGAPTPIAQVGNVSTPEARLLQIQPFDKTMIADIEKAILGANLGLTPSNDGNLIRIPFPALTEERRKDQVKDIKKLGEDAKIAIRNGRRDKNDVVKKWEKDKEISEDDLKRFQDQIQKVTDKFVAEVDTLMETKEKEILSV